MDSWRLAANSQDDWSPLRVCFRQLMLLECEVGIDVDKAEGRIAGQMRRLVKIKCESGTMREIERGGCTLIPGCQIDNSPQSGMCALMELSWGVLC